MTNLRSAVTGCFAAALALASLVGCGTSSPSDRARPARLYPFDSAVYYTPTEQRIIDHKLEQATAACMRDRGFEYPAADAPSPEFSPESEPDNPYGLLGLVAARTEGYGVVPSEVQRRQRAGSTATPESEPRYTTALVGDQRRQETLSLPDGSEVSVAVGGCVAQARVTVFGGGWDRLYYTIQSLSNTVIERTGADPAVVSALKAWSSCVDRAGYRVENPEELRESIVTRARAAADDTALRDVARAELAAAEADAICQDKAGLVGTTRDAQQRAERQVLTDQFRRDLDQLRQRRRAVLGH